MNKPRCYDHRDRTEIPLRAYQLEPDMSPYQLVWSPEGRVIATVYARTMRAAIRKAPMPYRRYLGEIYAIELE